MQTNVLVIQLFRNINIFEKIQWFEIGFCIVCNYILCIHVLSLKTGENN